MLMSQGHDIREPVHRMGPLQTRQRIRSSRYQRKIQMSKTGLTHEPQKFLIQMQIRNAVHGHKADISALKFADEQVESHPELIFEEAQIIILEIKDPVSLGIAFPKFVQNFIRGPLLIPIPKGQMDRTKRTFMWTSPGGGHKTWDVARKNTLKGQGRKDPGWAVRQRDNWVQWD